MSNTCRRSLDRIGELFPGCSIEEQLAIAEHACQKYSGRIGRSAAAKELQDGAVDLAVRAHVRHEHTRYDELLARGAARSEARAAVAEAVTARLERWQQRNTRDGGNEEHPMTMNVFAMTLRLKGVSLVLIVATACSTWVPAYAQESPPWPDTFLTRVEALALIQTLNAEILGSRSATLSLEKWCRDHRLAAEPKILAHVVTGVDKAPTDEQRRRLQVTDDTDVKYRRVQLRCGTRVLSEAENWYVHSRLTSEMNRLLETTETPFGKAVESLEPYRLTFAVTLLWSPLPDGWARESATRPAAPGRTLVIPDAMFEHRAVLYTREHRPLAEVNEVYQRQILAFPPPSPR